MNHCDGCVGCVFVDFVNNDGACPCTLCIIKAMCDDPCEKYHSWSDWVVEEDDQQ